MEAQRTERRSSLHRLARTVHRRSLSVFDGWGSNGRERRTEGDRGKEISMVSEETLRPKRSRSIRESLSNLGSLFESTDAGSGAPGSMSRPLLKRHRSRNSILSRSISRFSFPAPKRTTDDAGVQAQPKGAEIEPLVAQNSTSPLHTAADSSAPIIPLPRTQMTLASLLKTPVFSPHVPAPPLQPLEPLPESVSKVESPSCSHSSSPSLELSPKTDWRRFSLDLHQALAEVKGPKPVPAPATSSLIHRSESATTCHSDGTEDSETTRTDEPLHASERHDSSNRFNPLAKEFIFPPRSDSTRSISELMPPPALPTHGLERSPSRTSQTSLEQPQDLHRTRPCVSAPTSPRSKKRVSWHGDVEAALIRKSQSSASDLSGALDQAWSFPGPAPKKLECPAAPALPSIERFESPNKAVQRGHRRSESQISNVIQIHNTDIFKVYRPPAVSKRAPRPQGERQAGSPGKRMDTMSSFPGLPDRLHNPFEQHLRTPLLVPSSGDGDSETDESATCHDGEDSTPTQPARSSHEIETRALAAYERSLKAAQAEDGTGDSLIGLGIHIPTLLEPAVELLPRRADDALQLSPAMNKMEMERDQCHLHESWWM